MTVRVGSSLRDSQCDRVFVLLIFSVHEVNALIATRDGTAPTGGGALAPADKCVQATCALQSPEQRTAPWWSVVSH